MVKKTAFIVLWLIGTISSFGQTSDNEKLIELGKAYKNFMFRNEASKDVLKEIKSGVSDNLKSATAFIAQTISSKNKLLTRPFLSRPDDKTLKQIYIIRAINLNVREEKQVDNNKLIDSLIKKNVPVYELVDNYYSMLFTGVGNKNQPFDLSETDLKFKDFNLKDETEQGILALEALDLCATTIWGFMNIPKPPNTQKAIAMIKKFPKINGQPYFQYTDFYFSDFEMNIVKDKGPQSYKSYYLNKLYETLLSHLVCLNKEGGTEKEKNDLLLGSILKENKLYKYTKYKATLENLFKEQKRE